MKIVSRHLLLKYIWIAMWKELNEDLVHFLSSVQECLNTEEFNK
jgi:hypothetical protein